MPDSPAPVAAAIYARVSSVGQLGRDGDEDGYSLPAQVEACRREAASRGAEVAKIYMERAESARSDDRTVLQQMLRELPLLGVDLLIVHKVDRLARNRLDDATLYQRLMVMGIKLVSASENIDETPAGRLMHGMLASFAEYYSNNLATEVRKGLNRKHEQGGTPHKPPVGYLSKRTIEGSKDIRTVIVDPERAPLIKEAFELYATGEWTLNRLTAHLERRGLRSRGTPRCPEHPLKNNRINEILRKPYYMGIVRWNGRSFPGKHEPLIDVDTFDRVQELLTGARIGGERPQKHTHYLRGTVVCEKCHGRLLFGRHRSRSGRQYDYFSCNNRTARGHKIKCSSGHFAVREVELQVEQLYRNVQLAPDTKEQIRIELQDELANRTELIKRQAGKHKRVLKAIAAKQEKLVQLYYKDLVDEEVFSAEQDKLKAERRAEERLHKQATAQLDEVMLAFEIALRRVDNPYEAYKDGTEQERRMLNRLIFERIEIGEEGEVFEAALTPVYAALSAWEPALGQPTAPPGEEAAENGFAKAKVRPSSEPAHHELIGCKRWYYYYMSAASKRNYEQAIWRTGRKVGRTVYAQIGTEPSDKDVLIGVFDTRELAASAAKAHNAAIVKTSRS